MGHDTETEKEGIHARNHLLKEQETEAENLRWSVSGQKGMEAREA